MNLRDVLSVLSRHGKMSNISHGKELCNFVKLVTKCKLGCDPLLGQELAVVAVAPAWTHSGACYHYFVSLNYSNLSWRY